MNEKLKELSKMFESVENSFDEWKSNKSSENSEKLKQTFAKFQTKADLFKKQQENKIFGET